MRTLIVLLMILVGLVVNQYRRYGPYGSFGIGFLLMPIIFILQLMLARCFGFHRQLPTDDPDDKSGSSGHAR